MAATARTNPAEFFAGILKVAADSQSLIRRVQYTDALRKFDWSFEFSDDHWHYRKCHHELAELRDLQKSVDPDGSLWNQYAPKGYRVEVAA